MNVFAAFRAVRDFVSRPACLPACRCCAYTDGRYAGLTGQRLGSSVIKDRVDLLMYGYDAATGHGTGQGQQGAPGSSL